MSECGYSLVIRPNLIAEEDPREGRWLVSQGHGWARQDLLGTMDYGPRAAAEWFFTHLVGMTGNLSQRPPLRRQTPHSRR